MQPEILTVKQFNEQVNTLLGRHLNDVTIRGEISGYQVRQGKWVSFDLKDEESVLNCFCAIYQLDFPLADGQEVCVTGTPRIYVPYGKYSLNVRTVELHGEGAFKKAFEELQAKLALEGLFALEHKRPLPRFPEQIGIITSGEGAAVNDILKVMNGRWGGLEIFLLPVLVQGKNAPEQLVQALHYFNERHPVDVIIFGRGGGSLEDLQAFNSERVARAIFSSRIPIVSGIGHEHNTSIADLVADVRAATPSNAAELAVPDRQTITHAIAHLKTRSRQAIARRFDKAHQILKQSNHHLHLAVTSKLNGVHLLIQQLRQQATQRQQQTHHLKREITLVHQKLSQAFRSCLERQTRLLTEHQRLLTALNPEQILQRGYSITYDALTSKPIVRLADLPSHGRIRTRLSDGVIESSTSPESPSQARLF